MCFVWTLALVPPSGFGVQATRACIEWAQDAWFDRIAATEVYILWNKRGFLGYLIQNRSLSEIIQVNTVLVELPAGKHWSSLSLPGPRSWYHGKNIAGI